MQAVEQACSPRWEEYEKNRTQSIRKTIRMTREEYGSIQKIMEFGNVDSFNAFAIQCMLGKRIVHRDYEPIHKLNRQLSGIGNNINQIAMQCNASQYVTQQQVLALKESTGQAVAAILRALTELLEDDW